MSEEAAKRYCEGYDTEADRSEGAPSEVMAAAHQAGLAAVEAWARSEAQETIRVVEARWRDKCAELESLTRRCDVALLRAGVPNDGTEIAARIAVLAEEKETAEGSARIAGERLSPLAEEAHGYRGKVAELTAEVERLMADREEARRERDAAQTEASAWQENGASVQARLTEAGFAPDGRGLESQVIRLINTRRPALTEEQAGRTARRLCIEMGVGEMHVGRIARALLWGDDGEPVKQPEAKTESRVDDRICEACRKGDDGFGWYRHPSHAGVRHRGCAVDGSELARLGAAVPVHGGEDACPSCSAIFGRPSPCAMTHEFAPPGDVAAGPDPLERLELQTSDLLDRVAKIEAATPSERQAFRRIGKQAANDALVNERLNDLDDAAREALNRISVLEAAKPARPKVGPWVNDGTGSDLFDHLGQQAARVYPHRSGWGWWARKPLQKPAGKDREATREAAKAAALAVLRTWADVEGEERPVAARMFDAVLEGATSADARKVVPAVGGLREETDAELRERLAGEAKPRKVAGPWHRNRDGEEVREAKEGGYVAFVTEDGGAAARDGEKHLRPTTGRSHFATKDDADRALRAAGWVLEGEPAPKQGSYQEGFDAGTAEVRKLAEEHRKRDVERTLAARDLADVIADAGQALKEGGRTLLGETLVEAWQAYLRALELP